MSNGWKRLGEGREKQRVPFLRATAWVQRAREQRVAVELEAVGRGYDRMLHASWREMTRGGWKDRWFLLDSVNRTMTGYWEETGPKALEYDLERPFQATSVLVRDMLLLPLADLRATRERREESGGEVRWVVDVEPRIAGREGPPLREITVVESGGPAGHEGFERVIREFADDKRTVTREIEFPEDGWKRQGRYWLSTHRLYSARGRNGAVGTTTVEFDPIELLDDVPHDALGLRPSWPGHSIR